MAEVTGMTATAMQAIANASIVSGQVNGSGHLVLTDYAGGTHDAGAVNGPAGATGATGPAGPAGVGPTGSVIMFAASTPPTGWLVCNGAAVSRTTYSALFATIGTKFGAGDGTTTFNLPNMNNKFPRMDAAYSTNLGVTGGADTHTHTIADHTHTVGNTNDVVGHITIDSVAAPNVFMERLTGVASWNANIAGDVTTVASSSGSHTEGIKNKGTTDPTTLTPGTTNNDPPYLNLVFLIKI